MPSPAHAHLYAVLYFHCFYNDYMTNMVYTI